MKQNYYQPPDDTYIRTMTGQPLASFTRRGVALVIDFFVAGILFLVMIVGFGSLAVKTGLVALDTDVNLKFTFFQNWYSIVWLALYFTLSVYLLNGRTVGKFVCRIRIVSLVHQKINLWHSFERALGYGASALEGGFGFLQYFIRDDRRTVHDRIAETIVIYDVRKSG